MLCNYLEGNRCLNWTQRYVFGLAILLTGLSGSAGVEAADAEQSEPAVIRVASAEGTLVVRVDDPNVSVRIEGNELVVTGAGLEELRVATGGLKADGSKDGGLAAETVVSITRGDREILNIRRQAPGAETTAIISRGNTPAIALSNRLATALRGGRLAQNLNLAVPQAHPASKRLHNPDTGHDYQRIDVPMTWQEAKEYCERHGGHLATATSAAENQFIYENFGRDHVCWLGATDEENEGAWKWVTGEPWDYENWHEGEPSNNDADGGVENYLILGNSQSVVVDGASYFYSFEEKWNDQNATGNYHGTSIAYPVCEWDEHDAEKTAEAEKIDEMTSLRNFQMALRDGTAGDELTKRAVEHVQNFPDSPRNNAVAQMLMMTLTRGLDEQQSIDVLRKLSQNGDMPLLAEAADARIEQLEKLLQLKEEPLELKFTAVDSREFDIEEYRGKVVLIDFWATWCGPCVAGMPELIDLHKKHHEAGLEIVGISFDRDKEALEKFVDEHEMPWVQYFDGKTWDNDYGQRYGIRAIPTMWLVGRDGKVVDFSARMNLAEKVEKLLTE
jgi:thiol-disulfide isomerase/thioredoxin